MDIQKDTWGFFEKLRRRFSVARSIIGLLLGLLSFALVVQLRGSSSDEQLASARPEDLVRILSDLDSRQERLRQEISDLEESRRRLDSGAQGREAALAEAKRHADELGILSGTLPAVGPGLSIVITPQGEKIKAEILLDAVEELRGAGAEAMQIKGGKGTELRVVASTYFVDAGDGVIVDGVTFVAPYVIDVIGDPPTMRTALNIPGGVIDNLRRQAANAAVEQRESVEVSCLRHEERLRYARPVS